MAIGPYGFTSPSCQSRSQRAMAMCSLKTFPKPGLARMRSRSAAGIRAAAGVTLNLTSTTEAISTNSERNKWRSSLSARPRERKEGVFLVDEGRGDRGRHLGESERVHPHVGSLRHDRGEETEGWAPSRPPARGRRSPQHPIEHLCQLSFQPTIEVVHL